MSWYRQIKILYTICSNTFFFILWITVINGFLGGKTDYKLFLISLFSSFLMAYILEKKNNLVLSSALAIILSEVILFLIYSKENIILNSVFISFILFFTFINEREEVNYEVYKYKAKQTIVTLVVIGLVFSLSKLNNMQSILKFYIIFLISISILMREARNYYYSIKNKKSIIANIVIAVGIIIISLDSVFSVILVFFRFLGFGFYKIADVISSFIMLIINRPLSAIINYLRIKFEDKSYIIDNINNSSNKLQNKDTVDIVNNMGLPAWFTSSIKIIIFLMIIYFAYRLLWISKGNIKRNSKEIFVERERISKEKNYNNNFIKKAVKSIFRISDLREQAINVYRKFELKTNEKGIFRKYMTARQLENITKTYIENPEGIDSLTNLYNEAKFSTHKVTKENVETMKESLAKAKKQL